MCGRFIIPDMAEASPALCAILLAAQERLAKSRPDFMLKHGEIRPGDEAVVIARNRQGVRSVFVMRWGFRMQPPVKQEHSPRYAQLSLFGEEEAPPQKSGGRLVFNARLETAATRPLFAESMRTRRCLIPVADYVEWDHRQAPLRKYFFRVENTSPVYLAGLYRITENGLEFTVLTCPAAPEIADFHDRMPCIIPEHEMDAWLNPAQDPALLLRRLKSRRMTWKPA